MAVSEKCLALEECDAGGKQQIARRQIQRSYKLEEVDLFYFYCSRTVSVLAQFDICRLSGTDEFPDMLHDAVISVYCVILTLVCPYIRVTNSPSEILLAML